MTNAGREAAGGGGGGRREAATAVRGGRWGGPGRGCHGGQDGSVLRRLEESTWWRRNGRRERGRRGRILGPTRQD
jgi:hypothetical protein